MLRATHGKIAVVSDGFYSLDDTPSPRGSAGNLSWEKNVDMSLAYHNEEMFGGVLFKLIAFNIFDFDEAIDVRESDRPDYRLDNFHQSPRRLQVTARMSF